MKKRDIVKSNILFNEIINKGYHFNSKYYVLCSLKSDDNKNKFGVAVGTKVGNAVIRNKIKRQMRVIIDNNKNIFPRFYNYVIICKKEILNLSFHEMEKELIYLINKGEKNEE